jgi:hypothetical protein
LLPVLHVIIVINQALIFYEVNELLLFGVDKTVPNIKSPAAKSSGTLFVLIIRQVLFE